MSKRTTKLADMIIPYQLPMSEEDTFKFLDDYSEAIDDINFNIAMDVLLTNYSIYNQNDYDANTKRRSDTPLDDWKYWFHKKQDTLFLMKETVRLLFKRHMGHMYLDPYGEEDAIQIMEDKYGSR